MREDAFAAFLAHVLGAASIGSYISNARRVERELSLDLDDQRLSLDGIDALIYRLRARGVPPGSASSCRSALAQYASFVECHLGSTEAAGRLPATTVASALSAPAVSDWYSRASVGELLASYGRTLDELRRRKIVRTANAPVGDYAEFLVANALGLSLSGNSTSHHDAVGPDGCRYQVKGRRLTGIGSRQLGAIRALDKDGFDELIAVLFASDMTVVQAVSIPRTLVQRHSRYFAHTNSWRLILSARLIQAVGVKDITPLLISAANDLRA